MRVVAQRLCDMVRECSPAVDGENLNLSVSIGVATATLSMSGVATLMKRGDDALYESKRAGRNRVSLASEIAGQRERQAAE